MGKHDDRSAGRKGGERARGGDDGATSGPGAGARAPVRGRDVERGEKRRRKEAEHAEKASRKQAEREEKRRRKEAARAAKEAAHAEKASRKQAAREEKKRRKEAKRRAEAVGEGAIGLPREAVVAEEMAEATAAVVCE